MERRIASYYCLIYLFFFGLSVSATLTKDDGVSIQSLYPKGFVNQCLQMTSTTLVGWDTCGSGGAGTVTSVAINNGDLGFNNPTGSPITTAGTITLTTNGNLLGWAVKARPTTLVVGNGDTQTLTNKTLISPTISKSPTINGTTFSMPPLTQGDLMFAKTTSTVKGLAKGTNHYALKVNGNTLAWEALAAGGSGDITDVYSCSTGDCNSITIASGELLDGGTDTTNDTGEGILLPRSTSCASSSDEGHICWDTDNNVAYIGNGTAAQALATGAGGDDSLPDIQTFTSSGTWTKVTGTSFIDVYLISGAGGGGSGRKGALGTGRSGGGGGAAGSLAIVRYSASDVNGTMAITIGAGGAGGAAVSANSTSGNDGSTGSSSLFGGKITLTGGGGGFGGTTTDGPEGELVNSYYIADLGTIGGTAGGSGFTGTGFDGEEFVIDNSSNKLILPLGGGGGGGITSGNTVSGGGGGGRFNFEIFVVNGGTAGTSGGGVGGNATNAYKIAGTGGGGGGASTIGAAGAGGKGASYGGGGGGGGASLNDLGNSGAGGKGGNGYCMVVSY